VQPSRVEEILPWATRTAILEIVPARGLFPSSCVDLTESELSDATRERSSVSLSTARVIGAQGPQNLPEPARSEYYD